MNTHRFLIANNGRAFGKVTNFHFEDLDWGARIVPISPNWEQTVLYFAKCLLDKTPITIGEKIYLINRVDIGMNWKHERGVIVEAVHHEE